MAGYASPAWTNDAAPALNATNLLNMSQAIEIAEHPYGVCSTAAATAAKTVTVDFSGTLSLFTGLTVRVKFTNANTAASPTLNVNGTGAKAMIFGTGNAVDDAWIAGAVVQFTYDGTSWVIDQTEPVKQLIAQSYQRTCNTNMLDNWYFVGGGSQQDGGQFPINQRGQTSYSSSGKKIDRWGFGAAGGEMNLTNAGVSVKVTSGSQNFSQNVDSDPNILLGKTVTASALVIVSSVTTLYQITTTLPSTLPTATTTYESVAIPGLGSLTIGWANGVGRFSVGFANGASSSGFVTIEAVKFELGSVQTLCHNEGTDANPTWVLNEIPNFQQELAKCQRYFWNSGASSSKVIAFVGTHGDSTAGNTMAAIIYTPVPMRAEPTVDATNHSIRGNGSIWNSNLSYSATPLLWSSNIVSVSVTCSTASFPAYTNGYAVLFTKLTLSADL